MRHVIGGEVSWAKEGATGGVEGAGGGDGDSIMNTTSTLARSMAALRMARPQVGRIQVAARTLVS